MKKLWFRAKKYGWGWTPATWQGWIITLVYAGLLAWSVGRFTNYILVHSGEPFLDIVFPVLMHALWVSFLIGSFMYVCVKTGEKPSWRWGD